MSKFKKIKENIKSQLANVNFLQTIRIIFLIVLFCFVFLQNTQTYACTIFNKQQGDTVLVGNNEDWMYSMPSNGWFTASKENSYGMVCFANASYVQGGMNERGLFYDGATCPASKVPFLEGKPALGMDFGEVILSKCATVQEAVEMIKNYNIPRSFTDHIMFADRTGKSVVIEWVENELRILPKEGEYQLVTNFWLSNPQLGWYPCARFDKAKLMLEEKKEITVSYFTDILKATSQNWGDGGTRYSNVYDLKNKTVYVYYNGNFDKSIKYNLDEELKKLRSGEKRIFKIDETLVQNSEIEKTLPSLQQDEKGKTAILKSSDGQLPSKTSVLHNVSMNATIIISLVAIVLLLGGFAVLLFFKKRQNNVNKEDI